MNFSKMEGLGNDFIVVDESVGIDASLVRTLCNRHFGIGANGVLRVGMDAEIVTMEYWNADGRAAEMCGNGLRCVARYALDNELVPGPNFQIRTAVGDRRVEVGDEVRAELGAATVGESKRWKGRTFHAVSVGNPHLVALGEDPEDIDVALVGSELELATPGGANIGFAMVDGAGIKLRVWERGVGETLACGSGMVAAAAVGHHLGMTEPNVTMNVRGGQAQVELDKSTTWLTGPARLVFEGEFA